MTAKIGWRLFAHEWAPPPDGVLPARSFAGWHFIGVDELPICHEQERASVIRPSTVDVPMQGFPPVCTRCCLELERAFGKAFKLEVRHAG